MKKKYITDVQGKESGGRGLEQSNKAMIEDEKVKSGSYIRTPRIYLDDCFIFIVLDVYGNIYFYYATAGLGNGGKYTEIYAGELLNHPHFLPGKDYMGLGDVLHKSKGLGPRGRIVPTGADSYCDFLRLEKFVEYKSFCITIKYELDQGVDMYTMSNDRGSVVSGDDLFKKYDINEINNIVQTLLKIALDLNEQCYDIHFLNKLKYQFEEVPQVKELVEYENLIRRNSKVLNDKILLKKYEKLLHSEIIQKFLKLENKISDLEKREK